MSDIIETNFTKANKKTLVIPSLEMEIVPETKTIEEKKARTDEEEKNVCLMKNSSYFDMGLGLQVGCPCSSGNSVTPSQKKKTEGKISRVPGEFDPESNYCDPLYLKPSK